MNDWELRKRALQLESALHRATLALEVRALRGKIAGWSTRPGALGAGLAAGSLIMLLGGWWAGRRVQTVGLGGRMFRGIRPWLPLLYLLVRKLRQKRWASAPGRRASP